MENIFAKRRARLLAMKAMRENYVPGEKLVTCPHCGGESQRKDVAAALSVCPPCGYHFPLGAYSPLSNVLDHGAFRERTEKLTHELLPYEYILLRDARLRHSRCASRNCWNSSSVIFPKSTLVPACARYLRTSSIGRLSIRWICWYFAQYFLSKFRRYAT